LENGECDAVIAQKVMGLQLIDQLKLENIAPLNIKLDGFQQNFCFAVTEGNSELLSKLNEGLSIIIANGTFERLQKKWFSPRVDFKQTRLIIGGDKNYPPYEYLDENGEPAGYNIDLIKAIAKNLGILIEIKLGVWSDVREELSNGAIDVLPGMFYTQERDKYFDFSPPHLIIDHAIVTRKSSDKINDITELRGKSILVEKDDVMHDYLLKNGFDNQIKTSENVEEALVVLSKGQYDCAIIARRAAQYCISKNKLVNLRVNKNSYFSQEYCFAGKEGNEYLIGHLYDALSEIKASGEYKKIYDKWFGEYEPAKINYSRIIKYSIMVLILLILMIIVIVLWNRMLSRKVQAKTNELSERESLLFGIFDNMSSGSGVYKVINNGEKGSDYIVKFFNRKSLEIEGKELNEVIGKSLFELRPKIDEYGLIDLMKKVWQTGKSEFFPSSVYIDENYNNYYENFVFKLPSGDVVTIYNDVTDKRIAEITIKESEEKYRNLVETASDAIYLMDDKGIIIETNISACNMLGKTKNKIIGTSIGQIEPSLPIDDFLEFWVDKDFNKNFTVETTHIRKDGTLIPVEVSTMKYKQNNTVLYYGIARDITERKIDETVKMDNLLELEKNKKATMNLLKDLKLENDQRKNAENDLKSLNEDLEWKVNERTKQLENQNEDTIKAQESLVLLLEDVNDSRKELKDAINKLYKSNSDLEAFSYSVS
ncbi:MAG: transporter substrate-binding domain-containing protein, partial [Candidatus Delongbacteria bacterium]|nr:transporter substrate-binding domain-containing protein [Candidatus Delongbacteria bacterium]